MSQIVIGNLSDFSKGFVPEQFGEECREEDLRAFQGDGGRDYRPLSSEQIEILVKNNNTAEDWDRILVAERFDPLLVRNCEFWGLVRIGDLSATFLEYHELSLPVGLSNSTIISCDIGDNVVIRNVHYIAHYIVGDGVVLFNIDEMITVNHAKFGNGIIKQGEPESVRIWLEVGNENGGRKILPFNGMLPADAYIWSRYRELPELLKHFQQMTDRVADSRRGHYGIVGHGAVVKNSRIIKDALIGGQCYIKGANKLKNLTINSSKAEPTQIGEGVELVNGIVGYGNRIFYGVKAVRFLTGRNVQLKYGARLINSYLGSNSTVSCCEILNNLIFPFHEQHHNNSFLTASTLLGQSNIAAAATIGSNHNSRANDGEILAGRGFWPGLASSFKHSSRFASYCLLAKGAYPCELDITLPFSLVSLAEDGHGIQLMPGYWFEHNMYALVRNARKYRARDKREVKEQNIEYDFLAPDAAEEMIRGMEILRSAIEQQIARPLGPEDFQDCGKVDASLDLQLEGMAYRRKVRILYPLRGYLWYRRMLRFYGARELFGVLQRALQKKAAGKGREGKISAAGFVKDVARRYAEPDRSWSNIGGQLIPTSKLEQLIRSVCEGEIDTWERLHQAYDSAWDEYPEQKTAHALYCLLYTFGPEFEKLSQELIRRSLEESVETARELLRRAYDSRRKDYENPYRLATFRNPEEMEAVWGRLEDNSFLNSYTEEVDSFCTDVQECLSAFS
jgi:NDP-sugar pyrophosphorylase family protein